MPREPRQARIEELCQCLIEAGFISCIFDTELNFGTSFQKDLPVSLAIKFIIFARRGHKGWFIRSGNYVVVGYQKSLALNWNEIFKGLACPAPAREPSETVAKTPHETQLGYIEGEVDLNHYAIMIEQAEKGACTRRAVDIIPPIGWLKIGEPSNELSRLVVVADLENTEFPACTPEESVLRGKIVELSARCEFLDGISTASSSRVCDVLRGIEGALESYGMSISQADTALALLPHSRRSLSKRSATDRFRLVWSILGNDNAAAALSSPNSLLQLRQLANIGLITQYSQLTYLSCESIAFLTAHSLDKRTLRSLRRWLSTQPTKFSTLVETLSGFTKDLSRDTVLTDKALNAGLVTPRLYASAARSTVSELSDRLFDARRTTASNLLRNSLGVPTFSQSLVSMADVFPNPSDLYWELAYSVYAPVTLTYRAMLRMADRLTDRSEDFASNGIRFGGQYWRDEKGAFSVGPLLLFPSKNPHSIFAKASAGLCTTRDIGLFEREDHLQLTAYDPEQAAVVGSVQLYVISVGKIPALLLRGINSSSRYRGSAKTFADAAMKTTRELARESRISMSVLCEGLGLWSADSADPAIRGYLAKVREQFPTVHFDAPVTLFEFRGRTIMTQSGTALPR